MKRGTYVRFLLVVILVILLFYTRTRQREQRNELCNTSTLPVLYEKCGMHVLIMYKLNRFIFAALLSLAESPPSFIMFPLHFTLIFYYASCCWRNRPRNHYLYVHQHPINIRSETDGRLLVSMQDSFDRPRKSLKPKLAKRK